MVRKFLPSNAVDTKEVYEERVKAASYRPYVGSIVDFYASMLFASSFAVRASVDGEHATNIDAFYSDLKEDCDGNGTDLSAFMKDRFTQALIKRAAYWVVELPRDASEAPAVTKTEWNERGLGRATLRAIDAECVTDWESDDDGHYEWLKTYEKTMRRASPEDESVKCVETWRIYFKDRVDVYQISYDPSKPPKPKDAVPRVDSYDHGFACVPVMSLCLPEGLWLLDRASDAQLEHFRLSCALGWSLRKAAYPFGVFYLENADKPPVIGRGLGCTLSKEDEFEWAEPKCSSISVLSEEVKAQKDEIYRVSQQMAMSADASAGALGRSGLSKMADQDAQAVCLRGYAQYVREAIEATYELISDARGDTDVTFSVEGMSQFSTDDVAALVEAATKVQGLGIESPTLLGELYMRIANALLTGDVDQKQKDKIKDEIMASVGVMHGESRTGEPSTLGGESENDRANGAQPTKAR